MECPNCEQETDRLIDCALLRLPVDLSAYNEGDSFIWKEPSKSKTSFEIVIRNDEKLAKVWDGDVGPYCVECFTHGVWPSLYPYIANKPEQVILDGWRKPVWVEPSGHAAPKVQSSFARNELLNAHPRSVVRTITQKIFENPEQ